MGFSITQQGLLSTGKTNSGLSRYRVCSRKMCSRPFCQYTYDVSMEKSEINTDRSWATVSLVYCCSCYSQVLSKHHDDDRPLEQTKYIPWETDLFTIHFCNAKKCPYLIQTFPIPTATRFSSQGCRFFSVFGNFFVLLTQ